MATTLSSVLLRVGSIAWLAACLGVLLFGYANREAHDMPVAFLWLIGLLAFPIGTAAMVAVGMVMGVFSTLFAVPYHPFWEELPPWLAAVIAGYWQWFVFIPQQVHEYKSRSVK